MRGQARWIYLLSKMILSPLEALFTLLIFILSKEAGATVLQLTCLACAKPIVSLLAFQLNSFVIGRRDRIRWYLGSIYSVGCLPCFFFPWVDEVWFYVAAYTVYIATQRATFPAWNELLKEQIGTSEGVKISAQGSSVRYGCLIAIPLVSAFFFDRDPAVWKWFYFFAAALQAANVLLIFGLQPMSRSKDTPKISSSFASWKEGWQILRTRPDFVRYLWLFFLGGAGLIAIQPAMPLFFRDVLQLSYQEFTFGVSLCKGGAFLLTSSLWARWGLRGSLYRLNGYANSLSCLFFVCLLFSGYSLTLLYFAYLIYGVMQAGSEVSWNASGLIFSRSKESTAYSSLNLLLVGLRGCICPVLGQWVLSQTTFSFLFVISGIVCFTALLYGFWLDKRSAKELYGV